MTRRLKKAVQCSGNRGPGRLMKLCQTAVTITVFPRGRWRTSPAAAAIAATKICNTDESSGEDMKKHCGLLAILGFCGLVTSTAHAQAIDLGSKAAEPPADESGNNA